MDISGKYQKEKITKKNTEKNTYGRDFNITYFNAQLHTNILRSPNFMQKI